MAAFASTASIQWISYVYTDPFVHNVVVFNTLRYEPNRYLCSPRPKPTLPPKPVPILGEPVWIRFGPPSLRARVRRRLEDLWFGVQDKVIGGWDLFLAAIERADNARRNTEARH